MSKDTILVETIQEKDPLLGEIEKHNASASRQSSFPLDVMGNLKLFINECTEKLNQTPDYVAAGVLSAVSTLIGNRYKVKVKDSWLEKPNLFIVIVGRPGDGKTNSINIAYDPVEQQEKIKYDHYKNEVSKYNADQKKGDQSEGLEKPKLSKSIVQDFTIEALLLVHSFNQRGLTIKMDEAIGFFKNIGRYNSSGELEMYLSLWSGQSVSVDRATKESLRIDDSCVGFVGSIQSSILHQMTKDDKASNGFLDRLLWVYPKNIKKQYWGAGDISKDTQRNYNALCKTISNWADNLEEPRILTFEPEAWDYLEQWQNYNTDLQDYLSDVEVSIIKKLEQYIFRFCIILETIKGASVNKMPSTVSEPTVKDAILLYDYFYENALKVRDNIDKVTSPLEALSDLNKRFYSELYGKSTDCQIQTKYMNDIAMSFFRSEGEEITSDTAKKRVQRFSQKKELFKKIKHGVFELLVDPNNI